ncbi:MAG: DUF3168 domain-containing protein [Planctomycetota bacterium]
MAKPEANLYAALIAATPVTDLVGTQIYPVMAPPDADPPYVVYGRTGTDFGSGASVGDLSSSRALMEVVSAATSYAAAKTLADAVRTAAIGPDADGKVWVILDESDDFDLLPRGQDMVDVYLVLQNYGVFYAEV